MHSDSFIIAYSKIKVNHTEEHHRKQRDAEWKSPADKLRKIIYFQSNNTAYLRPEMHNIICRRQLHLHVVQHRARSAERAEWRSEILPRGEDLLLLRLWRFFAEKRRCSAAETESAFAEGKYVGGDAAILKHKGKFRALRSAT